MPTPQPNAIGWFDLYVDDRARATAFYEAVFQRKLAPLGDPTGETRMHGFPADMAAYGAGGALVYFSVDDCAVEAERVSSAGGRLLRPKFSIGEFGWVALCSDTEGNVFGLRSMR